MCDNLSTVAFFGSFKMYDIVSCIFFVNNSQLIDHSVYNIHCTSTFSLFGIFGTSDMDRITWMDMNKVIEKFYSRKVIDLI